MNKIAVLLTCYNRKDLTLRALSYLFEAFDNSPNHCDMDVYLTDDASTDGTSKAIKSKFPNVILLKGDGNLFWAGGMRNSWKKALKKNYDGFLLLNDDTFVYRDLFFKINNAHLYSKTNFKKGGIYIGSTQDKDSGEFTYGGRNIVSKIKATLKIIKPNGNFQRCELGNANIMFVSKNVQAEIGILDKRYIHGKADYDYTLSALKHKLPVFILPEYCGTCSVNKIDKYKIFKDLSLKERFVFLNSPKGLSFRDSIIFEKRFFRYRFPIVYISGYLKVLFPKLYIKLKRIN